MNFKKFLITSSIIPIFLFISCSSNKIETPVKNETVPNKTASVEDVIEVKIEKDESHEEYLRSTGDIQVTREEFDEDKAAILRIISELSKVMDKQDFEAWKTYIDPASLDYYSNPANLRKAQKKLPDKTKQIKGMRDYFRYVFIPSRKISKVDEIRYLSKTNIKAVEVREDETLVVYYYFKKVNGKWKVSLPEL